jgi:hypothetical protein
MPIIAPAPVLISNRHQPIRASEPPLSEKPLSVKNRPVCQDSAKRCRFVSGNLAAATAGLDKAGIHLTAAEGFDATTVHVLSIIGLRFIPQALVAFAFALI